VGKHSCESSSKSVETKRSAINSTALLLKRQTDGKNKNGYVIINHIVCTVFQSPAVVRLRSSIPMHSVERTRRAVEPSVVALSIENLKKRSSFPASHKTVCRPLLPSGPGGVGQCFVAQDLTPNRQIKLRL